MIELNAFQLKIIALVTMTIDHIGYFIFPDIIAFRIIGRLSFVIFAFFVANAYIYTSNRLKHGLILLACGIAFDLIILLMNSYINSNIFITLAIGYFIIYFYDLKKYYIAILILLLTFFIPVEYGFYGVILIFTSYLFFKEPKKLVLINTILILLSYSFLNMSQLQLFSIIGSLLLCLYNNERGRKLKYFFYFYYPIHIVIIYWIANNIGLF